MTSSTTPRKEKSRFISIQVRLRSTLKVMAMSDKGATGLFGNNTGISLPPNDSQLAHIFGDRPGHLPDTPRNRQRLVELANDEDNYAGRDKYGNAWHGKIESDGSQTWTVSRGKIIQDGGSNATPRPWDEETGFNNNPLKRRKK